jgi:hypothetical protein
VINRVEEAPRGGELLSTDAVRLAVKVTGGPTLWFLWRAGSGQDPATLPVDLITKLPPVSVSSSGQNIESDARQFQKAVERWREISRPVASKPRRTLLGQRLDKIRERIKASGQPLLSWKEIDRELAERRR